MDNGGREDIRRPDTDTEEIEAEVLAPPVTLVQRTLFRGGALSAFGHRDFRILWSGAFVSNTGTWIHTAVLLWFVKQLTGSDAWVAAVMMANFLPIFFLVLYSGSLADQFNRKKLIISTQALMMAGALALGIFTSLGMANLGVVMVLTAFMGVAFVFNFPAWRSIIPDLVPSEDMLGGIALDAAQFNMARFVGPTIGSIILDVWGVATAFYVNAASFLAVIVALLFVRAETLPAPRPPEGTFAHIVEVLKYVRHHRWAFNILIVLLVFSFFGLPFIVLLPAVARDVLQKGATGYGVLMGCIGLGAVMGAPVVTMLSRMLEERSIIKINAVAISLLLVGFSLSKNYWLSLFICMGLGASALMMSASINTVLQSRVERYMRGRIMSLYILVFQGIFPIGGLLMGFLSDVRSTRFSLLLGGLMCLGISLVLLAFPSIVRGAVARPTENETR